MKLPTNKIIKNRPLSEPIRLQDLEDSARSQKKLKQSNNRNKKTRKFQLPEIQLPEIHFQCS